MVKKGPRAKMSTLESKIRSRTQKSAPGHEKTQRCRLWPKKYKRCALKNHAEPCPRNCKRSHIVQVMAKNHSGGHPSTYWYMFVSHFPFPISCFQFLIFCLPSFVSQFRFLVSHFQFPVSCFPFPVTHFPFPCAKKRADKHGGL